MTSKFLKRIFEVLCHHEFSWPHSGTCGQDYQVCVRCGAVYEYDWGTMRRTRRAGSAESTSRTSSACWKDA